MVVGRAPELAALRGLVDAALDPDRWGADAPRSITIVGLPRAGATTLFDVAAQHATDRGMEVRRAVLTAADRSIGWSALSALLASGRASSPDAAVRLLIGGRATPDQVFASFAGWLDEITATGSALLLIDRVHFADFESVGALTLAARHPLVRMVVGVGRAGASPIDLDALHGDRHRRLELGGLSLAETGDLAFAVGGVRRTLSEVHELAELTGGLPGDIVDIVAACADGSLDADHLGTIAAAKFTTQLERLDGATVAALERAALLRRPTVGVIADADKGALRGLEQAERTGLIVVSSDGTVEFCQQLLRHALLHAMGGAARRRVAGELVTVVEPEERLLLLASMNERADEALACELDTAAESAGDRGDLLRALRLGEAAANVSSPGLPFARRCAVVGVRAGDLGDWDRSTLWLRRAVSDADDELLAEHVVPQLIMSETRSHGWQRATAIWREFGDRLHGFEWSRARILLGVVKLAVFERVDDAVEAADSSIEVLATASRNVRIAAELVRGNVRNMAGLATDIDRLTALSHEWDGDFVRQFSSDDLVMVQLAHGRFDAGLELAHAIYDAGVADNDTGMKIAALGHIGELAWAAGDWARCMETFAEIATLAGGHTLPTEVLSFSTMIRVLGGLGDEARMRPLVGQALGLIDERRTTARALLLADIGSGELSLGNDRAAFEVLDDAFVIAHETGFRLIASFQLAVDLIEAAVNVGNVEAARRAAALATESQTTTTNPRCAAEVAYARALVGLAEGSTRAAEDAADAAARYDRLGIPFGHGRALNVAGLAHRRAGQRRLGADAFGRAAAVFNGLGATRWEQRALDSAKRLGIRSSSSLLSEAEREVVGLVASGLGNQQVADTMFVSLRTVESHLTRVYRKAGVRSRAELIAKVNRGELPAEDERP